jgi:hypothetical protein
MKRIFGLLLSICIALAGLSAMLFGLPGSIVKAEQPAKSKDVILVNGLDGGGQITEHRKTTRPIDTSLQYQVNIGTDSFGYSTVKYPSYTYITSDAPDPSDPGETIVVYVWLNGSHGLPTGWVTVTTAPGGPSCSFYFIFPYGVNHCPLTIPLPGSYVITAHYAGNSTYLPSSDTENHTVIGFILDPPTQSGDSMPGAQIDYEFSLTNKSPQADSYNLTLGAHNWDTLLSDSQIGPVAPGASGTFNVTVTIPPDADWYDTDSVVVTASSVANPAQTDTSRVTTRAYAPPQISVSPVSLSSVQYPNEITTQKLMIQNGNGVPLTFQILGFEDGISFSASATELYGYAVPGARLRVTGLYEDTMVDIIDLDTGQLISSESDLDQYEVWDVYPSEGSYYKVNATKPVVGYASDFNGFGHATFIPSVTSKPVGKEFIFYFHCGDTIGDYCYVFAIENAQVDIYDPSGALIASRQMQTGEFWQLEIPNNGVYRVVSTGRIDIEIIAEDSYTTVPSVNGSSTGFQFYFATHFQESGAFAVFAYQDAQIRVYDLESGDLLYSHSLNQGEYWWQTDVYFKKLRLESTGLVEVWAGATKGGTAIEDLGDDISYTEGNHGQEYFLHSLMDGSILFSPFEDTTIDIDGTIYELGKDEYLHLSGCCYFRHVLSDKPILVCFCQSKNRPL